MYAVVLRSCEKLDTILKFSWLTIFLLKFKSQLLNSSSFISKNMFDKRKHMYINQATLIKTQPHTSLNSHPPHRPPSLTMIDAQFRSDKASSKSDAFHPTMQTNRALTSRTTTDEMTGQSWAVLVLRA